MRLRPLVALILIIGSGGAAAADLVVSAASSLTDAFQAVGKAYEGKHPGTHVLLNFAASDVLLRQIASGAPADVFASADQTAMDKAVEAKAIEPATRQDFASNRLVLIVPKGSKARVTSPVDLKADTIKRVAYGDPASVPVGRYTKAALEQQGLWDVVSAKGVLAQNVRQSLDYVARGEVDAGFVFATDASIVKDKVEVAATVPTPKPITYPIAVVAASKQAREAASFEAFVQSPEGRGILAGFGFQAP
ncbi:molybdate ABC transporter substrate-binding protein [Luteibacter rhizovicinus DSM 16549]|uniref:Molybdate ABC transporter substrate-binding protein n=1 Tax=Luteibacter rhizovicinus DSM 16549 TaxID=1440763 RepID=A0A0G9HM55_9GAMM|nr:molybdate ABC transporter substrate-binding protein [Luteibacter rhizovicinus]APG03586.1 molybdate ABC transporter substrate-binding protein [Luteibacter rhizovicinus DSM 16549]KLD68752.1 molybdate ABC transporter substrate-binding protein [Luteibacter rhizovicinus DSM 16549]KLD77037.1 molybdate ABC transporter substrate-binding protein [Xanthomonas hyacinthi DSM 19077]